MAAFVPGEIDPNNPIVTNLNPAYFNEQQGSDPVKIGKLDTNSFNTSNPLAADTRGFLIGQNYDKYRKFIHEVYPSVNLDRQAAQQQPAGSKIGSMFARGVIGEILAQGVVSGIGGLIELPVALFDEIRGADADFSNVITRLGDNINNTVAENNPIFRYNPGQAFDWDDLGWWTENGVSIFSTVGMFVPSMAAVKAASYFSKAMKGISVAAKAAKLGKVGTGVAKTTNVVADIFNTEKYWAKLAHSSIAMRNAENLRESSQIFNNIRDEALKQTMDPTKYQELLASKVGQEFLREGRAADPIELANFIAAKAAWRNYGINATNVVFDVIQLAPIFRGFKTSTRNIVAPEAVKKMQATMLAGKEVAGKAATKPLYIGTSSFLRGAAVVGEQATEGVEELINAIGEQEGNWYGKHLLGLEKDSGFNSRLNEYMRDPSSWEQAFWGFAGGVVFSGGVRAIRTVQDVVNDTKDPHSTAQKIEEVKNRFVIAGKYAADIRDALNGIHPETKEAFKGTDAEIETYKNTIIDRIIRELGYALGLNASRHRNVDLLLDMIEHEGFKSKFLELGVVDENGFAGTLSELKKNILDAEATYKKVYDQIFTSTESKPYLRERILGAAVNQKSIITHVTNSANKAKTKASNLRTNNPALQSLIDANADKDFEGTLNNIINSHVIGILEHEIESISPDENVQNVLNSRVEQLKAATKLSVKELGDKTAEGNFSAIEDLIAAEVDSRIYDIILQGENKKYEELVDPTKSVPKAEKQIQSDMEIYRSALYSTYRKEVNDQTTIGKDDTVETIDKKLAYLDAQIADITDNKHDPLAKKDDPLKKLDSAYERRYLDTLENRKRYLNQEKNRKTAKENIVKDIEDRNAEVATNLEAALKRIGINQKVEFTGKRFAPITKFLSDMLKSHTEDVPTPVGALSEIIKGTPIADTTLSLIGDWFRNNYFSPLGKQKQTEEGINELLVLFGYVTDFTLDDVTTNPHLADAEAFENALDNEKPVFEFTSENPITPSKVDLANKWISNLINNTRSGIPLFDNLNPDGSPKENLFVKFETVAAAFAESVNEEEFRRFYPLLKEAYFIVANTKTLSTTGTKMRYNQKKYVDNITADSIIDTYGTRNPFKDYEINNSNRIDETGGPDATNIYLHDVAKITYNNNENGDTVVDKDTDTELLSVLANLQPNSEVRLRVHSELTGDKGFSANKNNLSTVPIVVEVIHGDRITKIGSVNALENTHDGVKYNFNGKDWIDTLINDRLQTNSKTEILKSLYPFLQTWYNNLKMRKDSAVTSDSLNDLLDADKFGLLNELLGREKNLKSKEGKKALLHVAKIIFYGQNTDTNLSVEFDATRILSNLLNWKDKLYRDYVNTRRIRELLANDVSATLTTTVKYATTGNIVKSVDEYGNTVFRSLTTLGNTDNLDLYRISKGSNNMLLEGVRDKSKTIPKTLGSFKSPLYIGLKTTQSGSSGRNVIPVPVFTNTLDGSKLKSNNSDQLIERVNHLIKEVGKLRAKVVTANKQGDDVARDMLHTQINDLLNTISHVIRHTFDKIGVPGMLYTDHGKAVIATKDSKGRNILIVHDFYNNKYYTERTEDNKVYTTDATEADFIKELGKLNRNVNYDLLGTGEYTDILGNKHKNYEEYLIKSNSIVTDIGTVVDNKGNKLGHFMPQSMGSLGGVPMMVNIDASVAKKDTRSAGTFGNFSRRFTLDAKYDFVFSMFDTLVQNGVIKFSGKIGSNKVVDGRQMYVGFNPTTKTLSIYKAWEDLYKKNPTAASLLLVHDIIHAIIATKSTDEQTALLSKLDEFRNQIKSSTQYTELVAKTDKTEAESKILAILEMNDSEEILTYGLTDIDFAKFLDTIASTEAGVTTSIWSQLKQLIRDFFTSIGLPVSKLDELNSILDQFVTGKSFEKTSRISADVVGDVDWSKIVEDEFDTDEDYPDSEKGVTFESNNHTQIASKLGLTYLGVQEGLPEDGFPDQDLYNVEVPQGEATFGVNVGSSIAEIEAARNKVLVSFGVDKFASFASTPEVQYVFKATELLQSDAAKVLFEKGAKVGWDLNKILTELQVPKLQRTLLLGLNVTDREGLILEFNNRFGFVVEVNVARQKYNRDTVDPEYDAEGNIIKQDDPTAHYSNLTVPGGTKYKEVEFATPAIIPVIKGHAEFSTKNGIGWARMDDKYLMSSMDETDNIYYLNSELTKELSSLQKANPNGIDRSVYYGIIRKGTLIKPANTRRILEIQSDLFQKGRKNTALTGSLDEETFKLKEGGNYLIKTRDGKWFLEYFDYTETGVELMREPISKDQAEEYFTRGDIYDSEKQYVPITDEDNIANNFLQLLNKDNNWVTFFVKTILQDSIKNGYKKVLFPTGETVAKIEGHQAVAMQIESLDRDIRALKEGNIVERKLDDTTSYAIINEKGKVIIGETSITRLQSKIPAKLADLESVLASLKSESAAKIAPIEYFYNNGLKNVLSKIGITNIITDEYDNTWREAELSAVADQVSPIKLASFASEATREATNSPFTEVEERNIFSFVSTEFIAISSQFKDKKAKELADNSIRTNVLNSVANKVAMRQQASNLTGAQSQFILKALRELRDNDDYWKLFKFNLRNRYGYTINEFEDIEDDVTYLEKSWDSVDALNKNPLHTAADEVKELINRTLELNPNTESIDSNGERSYSINAETPSGFPNTLDFNEVHGKLIDLMKGALTKEEMLERLVKYSHDNNTIFAKSVISIWNELKADENLLNAWYITYDKAIFDSLRDLTRNLEQGVEVDIDVSNKATVEYAMANRWETTIISKTENGGFTKEFIDVYNKSFRALAVESSNFTKITDEIAEKLSGLYAQIGIHVPPHAITYEFKNTTDYRNTINNIVMPLVYVVGSNVVEFRKHDGYISKAINNPKVKFNEFGNLFRLASRLKYFTEQGFNYSFTNINNNLVYSPALPNFISNFFKKLDSNNEETMYAFLKEYAEVPENQHSLLLWGDEVNTLGDIVKKGRGLLNYKVVGARKVPLLRRDTLGYAINYDNLKVFKPFRYDGASNLNDDINLEYDRLSKHDWALRTLLYYFGAGTTNTKEQASGVITRTKVSSVFPLINPADRGSTMMFEAPIVPFTDAHYLKLADPKATIEDLEKLPVFKAVWNTVLREMTSMVNTKKLLFNTTATGEVIYEEYETGNGIAIRPSVKKEILDGSEAVQLFYHYKIDENGNKQYLNFKETASGGLRIDLENSGNVFGFHNITVNIGGTDMTLDNLSIDGIPFVQMLLDSPNLGTALRTNFTVGEQTTNFETRLKNQVKSFITQQIKNSVKEYGGYKEFLMSTYNKKENRNADEVTKLIDGKTFEAAIGEFALNTYLFNIEQIGFFYGSIADYKDRIDFNKRGGQVLSNGVPNTLRGEFFAATISDIKLKSKVYANMVDTTAKILGITRYNINRLSKTYDNVNITKKLTVDEQRIYAITSPYLTNDSANAVSLVRFDEFVQRIRGFGLYKQYADVITAVEEGRQLDREQTNKFASLQKHFYYGLNYDARLKKMVPNQIKNAEVILTPELIKNLELEDVNQLMIDTGIVQLNLESAEKVGSFNVVTISDSNGKLLDTSLIKNELLKAKRAYNYENLRMQQEVPDHIVNETNKLGTQIAKKIIENIPDDVEYTINGEKISGSNLKVKYFNLLYTNIWQSAADVLTKFEMTVNKEGFISGDFSLEKLLDTLQEEGINRSFAKNIIYSLNIGDNDYSKIPIWFNQYSEKFENLITSIITNGITNQRFPGVHAAQMSSLFMNKRKGVKHSELSTTKGINFIKDIADRKDYKLKSRVLIDTTDTKIIEAEVLLPRWSHHFYENGEVININDLPSDILTMIGYRIPTEAKYSMYVFKVVGFLPDSNGPSIVLPDDFVTQTGSDFDMDTVYTMLYNLRKRTVIEDGKAVLDAKGVPVKVLERIPYVDGKTAADLQERTEAVMRNKHELVRVLHSKFSHDTVLEKVKLINDLTEEFLNRDELAKTKYATTFKQLDKLNERIRKAKGKEKKNLYLDKAELQARIYTDEMFTDLTSRPNYKEIVDDVKEILKSWDVEDQNTRAARENMILDLYYSILTNDQHYLESIATSNFSDVKTAVNKLNTKLGNKPTILNNATATGQLEYRDKSIQARDLKGRSIAYDRFASIAQVAGITLTESLRNPFDEFKAPYSYSTLPTVTYDVNKQQADYLKTTYGKDATVVKGENDVYHVTVKHRHVGNNPKGDFRNAVGMLVNSYSAQTTAIILDAVKFGVPRNVNTYTFNIWKMLVSLGTTYDISTFFINQPVLLSLSDFFYKTANTLDKNKEIEETKRRYQTMLYRIIKLRTNKSNPKWDNDIAGGRYIWVDGRPEYNKKQYALLGYENNKGITLNESELANNVSVVTELELNDIFKGTVTDPTRLEQIEKHLVYQLQILETFKQYKEYSDGVTDGIKIFNTDSLGAGPTLDANNALFYLINHSDKQGILEIDGLGAATQIYPSYFGLNKESKYKSLEAHLNFGNRLAITLFSPYFIGQTPVYRVIKEMLNNQFSETFYNKNLTKQLTRYLNTLLLKDHKWLNSLSTEQKQSLLGIDTEIDITMNINDPNNAVKFEALSLANQIELLRQQLPKNRLIESLEPKLQATQIEAFGYHKIDYLNNDVPDTMTEAFNELWYSDNIYERIVARNLVRYEFLTTGFTFGYKSASKIIPSNIFYRGTDNFMEGQYTENGIGLSEHLYGKAQIANDSVIDPESPLESVAEVAYLLFNSNYKEQFIRSNWKKNSIVPNASTIKSTTTRQLPLENSDQMVTVADMLFVPDEKTHIIRIPARKFESIPTNRYWNRVRSSDIIKLETRVEKKLEFTLYKKDDSYVNYDEDGNPSGSYYYYPIGKLNAGEISDISIFDKNNRLPDGTMIESVETYKGVMDRLADTTSVDDVIYPYNIDMNFTTEKGKFRPELSKFKTTLDLIRTGHRTATTRHDSTGEVSKWRDAKVGDYIKIANTNEYIKVTDPITPIQLNSIPAKQRWSQLEGWSVEYINDNKLEEALDLWQMEYVYVGTIEDVMKDSNTTPTHDATDITDKAVSFYSEVEQQKLSDASELTIKC